MIKLCFIAESKSLMLLLFVVTVVVMVVVVINVIVVVVGMLNLSASNKYISVGRRTGDAGGKTQQAAE